MPKVETKKIRTGTHPVRSPATVRASSTQSIGVSKARGQHVFEGEGSEHIVRGARGFGRGMSDIGKVLILHEVKMTDAKASNELADLSNVLNTRLSEEVYPLKSGAADKIFEISTEMMNEGKEAFLERAGDNTTLRNKLSIGYDAVTQAHLQKVLNHKLTQDEAFLVDTAVKVGDTLQSEMVNLNTTEMGKAIAISKQIDHQLADYPPLAMLMKQAGFQSMFKSNARTLPEATQKIYEDPSVRKQIIAEIGSAGYDSIQAQIDLGKTIGLRDDKLVKLRAKEAEDKRVEKIMDDGYTAYTKGKLSHTYIDALDIPFAKKSILDNLLIRQNSQIDDTQINHEAYVLLSEQIRNPDQFDLTRDEVYTNILNAINVDITDKQGEKFIDRFSKKDVFKHPAVVDSYKELDDMFASGDFEDYPAYQNAVSDLDDEVRRSNGNDVTVRQFMKEILLPRVRKGATRKMFEELGWLKATPEYTDQGTEVGHYLLEGERDRINEDLIERGVKDKDGKQIDYSRLNSEQQTAMIRYIRSQ